MQDAFVQAVRKRDSYKGDAPLEAWVWRIVINEALGLRRGRASAFEWISATVESTNGVPEHDADVRAWIASLPERQRLVVFLRYFADLDYRSIASALDVEVGTVSATLAAAHAALRRAHRGGSAMTDRGAGDRRLLRADLSGADCDRRLG